MIEAGIPTKVSVVTVSEPLSVRQIDHAFEQAMAEVRAEPDPSLECVGRNHGIRLMRQRIGGQFLRNEGTHLTLDQCKALSEDLQGEIARREAPSPELTSSSVRGHADYWQGFGQGVERYREVLVAAFAAPALAPRRPRR